MFTYAKVCEMAAKCTKSRADKCNSFSSAKICYSNMNSYRVFAPVFFRVSHHRERERKWRMCGGEERSEVNFLPQILSVKHQFYLLFASTYFPSRSSSLHGLSSGLKEESIQQKCEKCGKKNFWQIRTAFVVHTYIRIALLCL